jgi:hypothetical protein
VTGLLSLREAGARLGCRDPRTARKRLAALGVPVLDLGGRILVDQGELDRAVRAHARPLEAGVASRVGGVRLAPGTRLWDGAVERQVGPRRVNGRPRGHRECDLQAAREAYGTPSASSATSPSTSRATTEEAR